MSGCHRRPDRITVAGAASVRALLPDLIHGFESDDGGPVSPLYGASGTLAKLVAHGTQVDVLIVVDRATLDRLAQANLVDRTSFTHLADNQLVLVAKKPAPRGLTFKTLDHLPPTQAIAIGNPDFVPAGAYARDLFQRLNKWDALRPRLLMLGDVAAVLAAAERGRAAAAVVYRTDVRGLDDVEVLDRAASPPTPELWLALTQRGAHNPRARAFAAHVRSAAGRRQLTAHGFRPPARH